MTDNARNPLSAELFNREMAENYDERNSKLTPISDSMHFLIRLVLGDLPDCARILCVGAGTGAEIISLAQANSQWTFVAVDPSAHMLDICRDRLKQANILNSCELIHGYVDDVGEGAEFDAVLSILVAHFIASEDRIAFYRNIHDRLKPGGTYVSTEICFDLDSTEFPSQLKNWERVQALMGATADSLQALPDTLRNTLSVLSPGKTEASLRAAGFVSPVVFFQAFLIRGWHATK
jgi:tRNA (cmo5U34)-methyltransferase